MIKLRSFYKLALYIGFSSSISACFSSANPKILKKTATEKTIETYLNDLVNQDKQAAKKLFCVPSKYSAYLKRHKYDVNTFEILNVEPGLLKNSDLEYDQVYVRQNVTKRNGERQIQKRHYAVWNTEDNYQYMTERYREYAKNPNKKMDRQKWSFNPKCISHYSDMSDSRAVSFSKATW